MRSPVPRRRSGCGHCTWSSRRAVFRFRRALRAPCRRSPSWVVFDRCLRVHRGQRILLTDQCNLRCAIADPTMALGSVRAARSSLRGDNTDRRGHEPSAERGRGQAPADAGALWRAFVVGRSGTRRRDSSRGRGIVPDGCSPRGCDAAEALEGFGEDLFAGGEVQAYVTASVRPEGGAVAQRDAGVLQEVGGWTRE